MPTRRILVPLLLCSLLCPPAAMAAHTAAPGTVKIYVERGGGAAAKSGRPAAAVEAAILSRAGASVADEQDGALVVQVRREQAAALQAELLAAGDRAEIRDDFDVLDFATLPIDARRPPPAIAVPWARAERGEGRDSYVLQFAAPPRSQWLARMRALDIRILDYVPQNGYVVMADRAALARLSAETPVQLVVLHQPIRKVSAALRASRQPWSDVAVAIARVPEAAAARTVLAGATLEELRAPEPAGDRTIHRLRMPTADLPALAAEPAVLWIEEIPDAAPSGEREAHLVAGSTLAIAVSGVFKPVSGDYRQWLSGQGVANYASVLGIAALDTGFDKGSTTDVHPDFKNSSGASFIGAVVNETSDGQANDDCYGHGTLVAGVLAGNAGGSAFNTSTRDNGADGAYLMGLGVAPGIRLFSGRIFTQSGGFGVSSWPQVYASLPGSGYPIVNNSWNYTTDTSYNLDSQTLDKIVRHSNGVDSTGQPVAIYFSAGQNETTPGTNSVTAPATAKNVIAVGGSENYNPSVYPDPPFTPAATQGTWADNGYQIWGISHLGPTPDGRIKPDVVAPASAIEGPRTRSAANQTAGCWAPNGVGAILDPTAARDNQHYWSRGTSFASPAAAGAGALLYTWFVNATGAAPKPALLKAMQINFALDLPTTATHRPEAHQGWGKTDLTAAFKTDRRYVWNNEATVLTPAANTWYGPSASGRYTVKDSSRPVKVTLVWSDRAGATGTGTALVNDLNLVVSGANGSFCVGNDFNTSTGLSNVYGAGGIYDHKNNVEEVVFNSASLGGSFQVAVVGQSITMDGINVWTGTTPRQDFAVFVDNAVATPAYQGFHDSDGCSYIAGWGWDLNLRNARINIDVYNGASFLGTTTANIFRQDLLNAGIGDGFHAFAFLIPSALKDGQPRLMRTQFAGTSTGLIWTPRWITCGGPQSPFTGSPSPIPGTLQVENFDNGGEGVAYHDTDAANLGGQYRSTGVDLWSCTDGSGCFGMGWAHGGEWLEYTVSVPTAGTYTLQVRVASAGAGGTFHVELNGANKTGALAVPNTGGWDTWQTISKTVTLDAGWQVLRLAMDSDGSTGYVGNFNYLKF